MAGFNGIAWFEIGSGNPAGAEKFYGEVFGWTLRQDDADGPGYQQFTAGDGPGLHAGGLADTGGAAPGSAAGGSVRRAAVVTPGGITFAHLLDPDGNQFEVFSMPSA